MYHHEMDNEEGRLLRAKPTDVLKPGEVAAFLRVDPKTVTRWAGSDRLRSFRTPGGHRRFYAADVIKIMKGENPQH